MLAFNLIGPDKRRKASEAVAAATAKEEEQQERMMKMEIIFRNKCWARASE